jgi:SAM-dependent methyltransferase
MTPIFRVDLTALMSSGADIQIDLGCGPHKRTNTIGIDICDGPGVDIVADLNEGLSYFPNDSVSLVHASHCLEHMENLEFVLAEILRVLRSDGRAEITVPHFANPLAYSDYTHRRFFGLYTFQYFVPASKQLARKVPTYRADLMISVISQRLHFRSPDGRRTYYRRCLEKFFNRTTRMQEFYEANLCYLFPCSEIKTTFMRLGGQGQIGTQVRYGVSNLA